MDKRIEIIDNKILEALSDRRILEKEIGAPSIVETSMSPEFRELRARRHYHGPMPEWMLKFGAFDWWVYSVAPKVNADKVKKEANGLYLERRLKDREQRRRAIGRALAASIACIMVVVSGAQVIGYNKQSIESHTLENGAIVNIDPITGDSVTTIPGKQSTPNDIFWSSTQDKGPVVGIERWEAGGEWLFISEHQSSLDSTLTITGRPASLKSNSSKKLVQIISENAQYIVDEIAEGRGVMHGKEIKKVDGKMFEFTKWKIKTAANLMIEYWKGFPINHQQKP